MTTLLESPDRQSLPPSSRNDAATQPSHDVPFFTVAHYRNPISPTTYEVPVGRLTPTSPRAMQTLNESQSSQTVDYIYNGSLDTVASAPTPVEIAFGPLNNDGKTVRYDDSLLFKAEAEPDKGQDRSPVGCLHSACGTSAVVPDNSPPFASFRKQKHEERPVVGCGPFFASILKDTSSRVKPIPPKKPDWKRASVSSDALDRSVSIPLQNRFKRHSVGETVTKAPSKLPMSKLGPSTVTVSNVDLKSSVYEDAGVTIAGERLESRMSVNSGSSSSEQTPRTPRTPRSKSREPSFCLELEAEDYPKTDVEYAAVLHKKILEAHQRQLLPLKEDVADWLCKLLGEKELNEGNLIGRLGNGVIMCRLAKIISEKASQAKESGASQLEVPCLPYKVWPRARSGTFFARDNITNFLRFCNRLGVHENLLFETEDLVCGSGERAVVLCLLEVSRLATKWWNLDAPTLVKLERELDDISARSDSGYSNSSSPRDSNLALHTHSPPVASSSPMPSHRPSSAPSQPGEALKIKMKYTASASHQTITPRPKTLPNRGPKPTPPPKPASIRHAITSLSKRRPNTFPSSRTYDRGWSGAKTTPTTPAATPTHGLRSRLPVACTPRSSGRSTPNTTPTTPTQSRKYLTSMQRSGIPRPARLYGSGATSASLSSVCSKSRESIESRDESLKRLQAGLDNKVKDIASTIDGVCTCSNAACRKPHVRRVADGKYDIYGKIFYVRLLNESHVMVRVGGGWDTLEHYLLRHEPTKITPFRTKNTETPAVCIRARYVKKSPTNNTGQDERFPSMVGGGAVRSPKK